MWNGKHTTGQRMEVGTVTLKSITKELVHDSILPHCGRVWLFNKCLITCLPWTYHSFVTWKEVSRCLNEAGRKSNSDNKLLLIVLLCLACVSPKKSKARIGSASKGYQEKPASFNVSATAFTYDAAGVYPITDFDKLLLHLLVALVEGNFHQFPPWLDLGRALWFSGIGIGSTLQKSLTWKARAYENCRNFHINHGCPQDRFMWSAKRFISRER